MDLYSPQVAIKRAVRRYTLKRESDMKIDTTKKVRNVSNENIVIMQDGGAADMTRVVALNESALELYNQLKGREFGLADVVQAILDTYEIDRATAEADAAVWVGQMREQGLIID